MTTIMRWCISILMHHNKEVLAYHEPSNRWVSFYDHKDTDGNWLDGYMAYKGRFFAFLSGAIYEMNSTSANRATFFDKKHDVDVDFVINAVANEVKVFNSIVLHSDGEWTGEDIEIPSSLNYPNGMVSKIPSTEWHEREGKYHAAFLRNMKTRSASATALDLRSGEPLRGETMYVQLTNTDISKKRLLKVDVYYDISGV